MQVAWLRLNRLTHEQLRAKRAEIIANPASYTKPRGSRLSMPAGSLTKANQLVIAEIDRLLTPH